MNRDHVKGAVKNILQQLEPKTHLRSGLEETPARVAKAWEFWTKGYAELASDVLKVFDDGGEKYDEMVVITGIPVYSHCEHHLAPFFGTATVAYIPNADRQQVIGLSKASRLVDVFARRLQVQERLTCQIADALDTYLRPEGAGVLLRCRHFCMESRGVQQPGVQTTTSALRGAMKNNRDTRAEFMALAT